MFMVVSVPGHCLFLTFFHMNTLLTVHAVLICVFVFAYADCWGFFFLVRRLVCLSLLKNGKKLDKQNRNPSTETEKQNKQH